MGFQVKDMLAMDIFRDAKILGGEDGLENEVLGATIIEAPDIVRFINGGEVLLTGFYAFQSCTPEEYQGYMNELAKKKVSALAMKRGRDVEYIDEKIEILLAYAKEQSVPVLEIPFLLSFRDILTQVMERLSNEEVIRLKYFKTTHDNFTALSLSFGSRENGVQRILDVLEKLIGNPVALFNRHMDCMATTDPRVAHLSISEHAKVYNPEFYSNYIYLKQKTKVPGEDGEFDQYLVRLRVMFNVKMFLTITALQSPVGSMDYIAVENAVTALKQELFRQHSIEELEEKFHSDIMNNVLNGKMRSGQELQRDIKMLGLPIQAKYRVLVFNLRDGSTGEIREISDKMKYTDALRDAVVAELSGVKVQKDMDKIVVIQQTNPEQKQEEYRRETKKAVEKIQKRMAKRNKNLRVRAGIGKEVEGILNIPESFKEAGDSLTFIDILGEDNSDHVSRIMMFSDMGIFKLLCQLDNPDMLMEYIPESLQKLCSYKRQQRQDLLLTLSAYLDRNQNLTKTAQDLFVHYKTAAYRIERITQITGMDFDNPSEVLAVRIGLVVYRMIENLKK